MAFKPNILVAYFYAHEKQESRVNENRKRARIRGIQPKTCDNCLFKEIFWCYADMLRDIENTCFRCSKQHFCTQIHPKTGRTIEILPHITKKNMWKRERNQY